MESRGQSRRMNSRPQHPLVPSSEHQLGLLRPHRKREAALSDKRSLQALQKLFSVPLRVTPFLSMLVFVLVDGYRGFPVIAGCARVQALQKFFSDPLRVTPIHSVFVLVDGYRGFPRIGGLRAPNPKKLLSVQLRVTPFPSMILSLTTRDETHSMAAVIRRILSAI